MSVAPLVAARMSTAPLVAASMNVAPSVAAIYVAPTVAATNREPTKAEIDILPGVDIINPNVTPIMPIQGLAN